MNTRIESSQRHPYAHNSIANETINYILVLYFVLLQHTITTMTGASLTATPAWKALTAHFEETKSATMKDMFAADADRFDKFSLNFEGMLLDFSKNRINDETMKLLYGLAKQQDVSGLAKKMFAGEKISK